jgi:hypothetical protein
LISGFMIVSNDRLQQQIKNQRWISLILGVALSTVHLYQLFSVLRVDFQGWISDWLYSLLSFSSTWC